MYGRFSLTLLVKMSAYLYWHNSHISKEIPRWEGVSSSGVVGADALQEVSTGWLNERLTVQRSGKKQTFVFNLTDILEERTFSKKKKVFCFIRKGLKSKPNNFACGIKVEQVPCWTARCYTMAFLYAWESRKKSVSEGDEQLWDHPAGKENGLAYGQLGLY